MVQWWTRAQTCDCCCVLSCSQQDQSIDYEGNLQTPDALNRKLQLLLIFFFQVDFKFFLFFFFPRITQSSFLTSHQRYVSSQIVLTVSCFWDLLLVCFLFWTVSCGLLQHHHDHSHWQKKIDLYSRFISAPSAFDSYLLERFGYPDVCWWRPCEQGVSGPWVKTSSHALSPPPLGPVPPVRELLHFETEHSLMWRTPRGS